MRRSLLPAFPAAMVGLGAALGAERPGPAQACAALDLHLVMLLERHGEAADLSGEDLLAIVDTMVQARLACRTARFQEGLALYQRVSLGPVTSWPLR